MLPLPRSHMLCSQTSPFRDFGSDSESIPPRTLHSRSKRRSVFRLGRLLAMATAILMLQLGVTPTVWAQQVHAFQEPDLVTTQHRMCLLGANLDYTARVGLIPIRHNESGDVHGHFGFTYYSVAPAAGQPARPVIFCWNGGPGANSTTVHLIGFGPRRLRTPDDAARPTEVVPGLYDNDATWLSFADLVFVDPVGTGFARPTKPEYAAEFYSTLGDIASTAEFIRVFRLRFDLLDSLFFLAGESYGTWRASGAAEILEKRGIHPAGVVLISGGMAMGSIAPDPIRAALFVPPRTATAFYHGRLDEELQRNEQSALEQAEAWALQVYAPAWEKKESLSDAERKQIIADLARFTGIDPATIDRPSLGMTSRQFCTELLKDRNVTMGRYDMRVVQPTGEPQRHGRDPAARDELTLRYLRRELGFLTDLAYQGAETGWSPQVDGQQDPGPAMNWVWNQGDAALVAESEAALKANQATAGSGDGPPGGSQPWMLRAMQLNPQLKLFVAAGQYDSLNSHALNVWIADQLEPAIRQNITLKCYHGGHIMYDTLAARNALRNDIESFVRAASH